ncbi:hypothetical protein Pst134EA_009543 [Puccinia striiformis f. sp. tritici]|uniref:hypothetical protein n=1 Tax=Puccinia striiformis f. sp. tritici TaxID=168172 RepID=UPI002008737C|nr:hypothetical protein Pst134EA_009543 [Puccinia striiformis f. sp. tritici]KAH9469021.1 hypothetical protein Pst134EA_009543 [Puccinia striiformis f. sp. tritici]
MQPQPLQHAATLGALYLFSSTRTRPLEIDQKGRRLDRLNPDILKARLWAVSASSLFSLFSRRLSLRDIVKQTLILTGLNTVHITSTTDHIRLLLQPLILTIILFWGVIYTELIIEPKTKDNRPQRNSKSIINIYVIRALILGPLYEEIVFRGCIIGFHLLGKDHPSSKLELIFTTPFWFGFAHVHGIWESYRTLGGTRKALMIATIQTLVQFIYTTIFGWYAAFIYLRTGSVFSATLCHSFCNYMGLPPLLESMEKFPTKRILIILNYLIGLFGFGVLLWYWSTEPNLFPKSSFWVLK